MAKDSIISFRVFPEYDLRMDDSSSTIPPKVAGSKWANIS